MDKDILCIQSNRTLYTRIENRILHIYVYRLRLSGAYTGFGKRDGVVSKNVGQFCAFCAPLKMCSIDTELHEQPNVWTIFSANHLLNSRFLFIKQILKIGVFIFKTVHSFILGFSKNRLINESVFDGFSKN